MSITTMKIYVKRDELRIKIACFSANKDVGNVTELFYLVVKRPRSVKFQIFISFKYYALPFVKNLLQTDKYIFPFRYLVQ